MIESVWVLVGGVLRPLSSVKPHTFSLQSMAWTHSHPPLGFRPAICTIPSAPHSPPEKIMLSPFRATSLGLVTLVGLAAPVHVGAQQMPEVLMEVLEWRELGPVRGGRSAAGAGIPGDRGTY